MKKQLTNDKLLFWIIGTYSKFYPTGNLKKWCQAIIVSLIVLGISYFPFIFDLVSDGQLAQDYYEAFNNTKNYSYQMLQCAKVGNGSHSYGNSCFSFAKEIPSNHYLVAMYLTYTSMAISLAVYVIGIIFFFDVTNITEKLAVEERESCFKRGPELSSELYRSELN